MAKSEESILQINNLVSGYGKIETLHGASLDIPRGRVTAVIGPNGSGKSTLLKSIAGLLKPWSGSIELDGIEIAALPAHKLLHLGMCTVPQGRVVFPFLTVEENLRMNAYTIRNRAEVDRRVEAAFEFVPALRERRKQMASNLSGGEQVLLSLAKVVTQEPTILLLDEPSLGLSPKMMAHVYETIDGFAERGITTFLVEQNVRMALEVADFVAVLVLGEVRYLGSPQQLEKDVDLGTLFLEGKLEA